MEEVENWLHANELGELVNDFIRNGINSMRRVRGLVLSESLLKEVVPSAGLRSELNFALSSLNLEHKSSQSALPVNIAQDTVVEVTDDNGTKLPALQVIHISQLQESARASLIETEEVLTFEPDLDDNSCSNSDTISPVIDQPSGSLSKSKRKRTREAVIIHEPNDDADASCSNSDTISPSSDRPCTSVSEPRNKRRASAVPQNRHLNSLVAVEFIKNLDLKQFLNEHQNLEVRNAAEHYRVNGFFRECDRNAVSSAIAGGILKHNFIPKQAELEAAANKICLLFPSETKDIYYSTPDSSHRNAYGKLPHKIKNLKAKLIFDGPLSETTSSTSHTKAAELSSSTDREDDAVRAAIVCLTHESRDDWPKILKCWSVTHALRMKDLKSSSRPAPCEEAEDETTAEERITVHAYFQEWSVLSLPNGILCLEQDFSELYPGKENGLLSKWSVSKVMIIDLINKELTKNDAYTKQILTDYDAAPEDKRDAIIINLLPHLCIKRTRGVKSTDVASVAEAKKIFILHVIIPGDLNRLVQSHRHYLGELGLTLQPFLIFVGPSLGKISTTYVQIESTRYHMRTPLKALDACFKSFFALDVEYPGAAKPVWLFIQKYFFDLHLPEDQKIPRVTSVISSLRGLASKRN